MSVMPRGWVAPVLPLIALLGTGTVAEAQDDGAANRLLVEAVQLWQEVGDIKGTGAETALARLDLLDDITGYLDVIISEHAESDIALRLVLGEPVGPFTLESLHEAVEEARVDPNLPLIDCREAPSSACIIRAISDAEAVGLSNLEYAELLGAYAVESGHYDILSDLSKGEVSAAHGRLAGLGRLTPEVFDVATLAMQESDESLGTPGSMLAILDAGIMLSIAEEALGAGVGGVAGTAQTRRLVEDAAAILEERLEILRETDIDEETFEYLGRNFVDLSRVQRALDEPGVADASLDKAAGIGARLSDHWRRELVFRLIVHELFAKGEIDQAVALIERPDANQDVNMHAYDLVEAGHRETAMTLLARQDQVETLFGRKQVLEATAEIEGAEVAFAQMRRFRDDPYPSELLVAIADGALAGRDPDSARKAAYRALAVPELGRHEFYEAAEALGRVAVGFFEAGDVSAARASLDRLLALQGPEPDSSGVKFLLISIASKAEAQAGDPERARALARELLAWGGHLGGDLDQGRDEVWGDIGEAAVAGGRVALGIEAAGRIRDAEARNRLLLDALYAIMEKS